MVFTTTVDDIIRFNTHIRDFWSAAHGWAPPDAARLLGRSRLDWQVSLSRTLLLWQEPHAEDESEGRLILAWANLAALAEGTLKWFLCVHEANYAESPLIARHGYRAGEPLDPDQPMLAELIGFFTARVWSPDQNERWTPWLDGLRRRRNAIHAFQDRDLGTWAEFHDGVEHYRNLLQDLDAQVPYPDEYAYPVSAD